MSGALKLTAAQVAAVAMADGLLTAAGLPRYSEVLETLDAASSVLDLTLPLPPVAQAEGVH